VARALRGRGARAKCRAVRWRVDARQGRRGSKCDAVVAAAVDGRKGGGGKWSKEIEREKGLVRGVRGEAAAFPHVFVLFTTLS
jgi:hypothetical protein